MVQASEQLSLQQSLFLFSNSKLPEDYFFSNEVLFVDAWWWILVFD
jgi:hypothetical protein